VRATVRSGGFELEGWIDADAVTLRVGRDIPVLDPHAWILRGARVRVVSTGAGAAQLEAPDQDFEGLRAEAACGALTFERAPEVARPEGPARYAHLRHDHLRILDAPGGALRLDLRARRPAPTLRVLETRGGASRVLYEQGVRLAGWVRDEDLEAGEGPDCDDCYGEGVRDLEDRCPDVPEGGDGRDVDGCPDADPPPVRRVAPRDVAIHAFPSTTAVTLGRVQRGAEVFVIARQQGWGRVRPRAFVVTPERPADFWVELAALEP
jgi:hypothetical protein